jgi:hypothetical protein
MPSVLRPEIPEDGSRQTMTYVKSGYDEDGFFHTFFKIDSGKHAGKMISTTGVEPERAKGMSSGETRIASELEVRWWEERADGTQQPVEEGHVSPHRHNITYHFEPPLEEDPPEPSEVTVRPRGTDKFRR